MTLSRRCSRKRLSRTTRPSAENWWKWKSRSGKNSVNLTPMSTNELSSDSCKFAATSLVSGRKNRGVCPGSRLVSCCHGLSTIVVLQPVHYSGCDCHLSQREENAAADATLRQLCDNWSLPFLQT